MITRSFIGALALKFFTIIWGRNNFNSILNELGLPFENKDFVLLIDKIEIIRLEYFILFTILIFLILYFLVNRLKFNSK